MARPSGCAAARRPSNAAPTTTASSSPRRCTTWCSVASSPSTRVPPARHGRRLAQRRTRSPGVGAGVRRPGRRGIGGGAAPRQQGADRTGVGRGRAAPPCARPGDEESRWEALESYWESAQRCHSYLMLNHAAHLLGAAHIRAGAAVDGLLLLRAPARDWLLRGDTRVWDVLHTIATGLAASGDVAAAARLAAAIGDRRLTFVSDAERIQLRSLIEAGLSDEDRARHERAGRELDAGAAVAEALQRIEALAPSDSTCSRDLGRRRLRPDGSTAGGRRARRPRVRRTSRSPIGWGSAASPPRPTCATSSSVSAPPAAPRSPPGRPDGRGPDRPRRASGPGT